MKVFRSKRVVTPDGIRIRKAELDQTLRARAAARARKG